MDELIYGKKNSYYQNEYHNRINYPHKQYKNKI